jgi:DNA invertase Pin-like site-specific DNA recombinase
MNTAIPYYRVSTERQGHSGLGLDAQRLAVSDYASKSQLTILEEYTEIESGKNKFRPILLSAIAACKKGKSTLLIAKLDRLGRNVAFISQLMESGIDFVAVDNPYANKFTTHLMAAFAEFERDQISRRTKEALAAAKARGVVLGEYGKNVLSKKNKADSLVFARQMHPIIESIRSDGFTTIREIRGELIQRKIPTYSGKQIWHVNTVHQLLKKLNN